MLNDVDNGLDKIVLTILCAKAAEIFIFLLYFNVTGHQTRREEF